MDLNQKMQKCQSHSDCCQNLPFPLHYFFRLSDVKNNLKYEHSVRLAKLHREEEDKLYAINLKIAAPKYYYKYIITPTGKY